MGDHSEKIDNIRKSNVDGEVALIDLLIFFWGKKLWILGPAFFAAVISVSAALFLPNIYESQALLAPKSDTNLGSMAGLARQYGELASLAGISLAGSSGEQNRSLVALEKLQSLDFFTRYMYDVVLPDLIGFKSWDAQSGVVSYDENVYDANTEQWVREVDYPFKQKPSPQEAHLVFLTNHLRVVEEKASGFTRISVEHQSPSIAHTWLSLAIQSVSEELREKDISDAERSIMFLEQQRQQTTLISLDQIFAQLIEEQMKTIMLAKVSSDYVFDVIDPPVVPELKIAPKRWLICVLGTMFGGLLGFAFVVAEYFWVFLARRNNVSQNATA